MAARTFALSLGVATAALTVLLAPPASATEDEFLNGLRDRYTFLSDDQLLSEGQRVCSATRGGVLAPDAVVMVRDDLRVSTDAALKIVTSALLDLC
ncbi:DUF732 domain-containing protein [Mycolicibacterium elephantis]|uniref:DUF732 domain-containing protein n=1 Tax=Mycolicibacterium elephantis DSM 44368 TaxID=1335622 RepID=A0A439DRH3_9MYCO|nr:DUF732 domain-containing protein [Mycolicibacterium elephantis]RWA18801.1 hypothetical protein MELE44368_03975 [Mycolicibacterium elephantis DSM 44368]